MNITGLTVGAPKFSEDTRERIKLVLSELRLIVKLPEDAIKESRFNSDDHVLWLMESGATEEEVNADINAVCTAGLIEAAKSDHWYKFEKDYGIDDDYGDEYEDEGADY